MPINSFFFLRNMKMERDLLTHRLTDFMMEIMANHMEDLVHNEKMQDERFVSQDQITGVPSYNQAEIPCVLKKPKNKSFNIVASNIVASNIVVSTIKGKQTSTKY